jgi:hypothetical protein
VQNFPVFPFFCFFFLECDIVLLLYILLYQRLIKKASEAVLLNFLFFILQAEPSPTTGSFIKSQLMHGLVGSAPYPVTTVCSNTNTFSERNSNFFEFKPHATSNMVLFNEYYIYEIVNDISLVYEYDQVVPRIQILCVNYSLPKFLVYFKLSNGPSD